MTYLETLRWMFGKLPMYQRQGAPAFRSNLSNIIAFAKHLNAPERQFNSIHVGGTNGKGSTCHMLASVLQEAGYKVGLYTSPHLKDYRERIRINGTPISKAFVCAFIERHKLFLERYGLSFFEMTVGMAFHYFSSACVDLAVVEVGLGGRLDATNIITPKVSIITNIGLDHTAFLGNTLARIAKEKGGIIKPNTPIVIGETQKDTAPIFSALATKNGSDIFFADRRACPTYKIDLAGAYQVKNKATVCQTVEVLRGMQYHITSQHLKRGLLNTVKNTGLMGRWQVLKTAPKVVCDTAHNKEALAYVVRQILESRFTTLHIVFGMVTGKDVAALASVLPKKATYYFCKPNVLRGLDATVLRNSLNPLGFLGAAYHSVADAYRTALRCASKDDFVFVGGSTFVVAEVL